VHDDPFTPLMQAVLVKDREAIDALLEQGADLNEHDTDQQWTALHLAARDNDAELVTLLLDHGAEVDPVDVFGDTPLWRATFEAGEDMTAIRVLLEHGADPDRANASGTSPRSLARTMGRDDLFS
jgi:uncharacterized protein